MAFTTSTSYRRTSKTKTFNQTKVNPMFRISYPAIAKLIAILNEPRTAVETVVVNDSDTVQLMFRNGELGIVFDVKVQMSSEGDYYLDPALRAESRSALMSQSLLPSDLFDAIEQGSELALAATEIHRGRIIGTARDAETVQTAPDDRMFGDEGTAVLHDHDFLRFAPALDLSTEEWLRVLQAHNGSPSTRRQMFRETLTKQLAMLSSNVHDHDPCSESIDLSSRINALPRMMKLTILETIERFCTRQSERSSLNDTLQHLGLRPCASAQARLAALAHRQRVLPG